MDDDAASSPAVGTDTGIKRTRENTARGAETPFFFVSGVAPCKGAPGWLRLLAPSALPALGTREIQASTSRLIK